MCTELLSRLSSPFHDVSIQTHLLYSSVQTCFIYLNFITHFDTCLGKTSLIIQQFYSFLHISALFELFNLKGFFFCFQKRNFFHYILSFPPTPVATILSSFCLIFLVFFLVKCHKYVFNICLYFYVIDLSPNFYLCLSLIACYYKYLKIPPHCKTYNYR